MTTVLPLPATRFVLPEGARAARPPELRGVPRDQVRLLVARTGRPARIGHRRFSALPSLLEPGDLVVVNTSATLAAALEATSGGRQLPVHVSGVLDDGSWIIEPRRPDGCGPDLQLPAGSTLQLPGDVQLRLLAAHPDPGAAVSRLWRSRPSHPVPLEAYLQAHGRPVGYGYLDGRYPLSAYQTVFAVEPGSAEMASAGRPFTADLVVELAVRGVAVAPVILHAGVSSPERHEPPQAERFRVPAATARLVNTTRAGGGRVVAVGTTVVRALESAARPDGTVTAAGGWTDLVLGPDRSARVVTGLVTGLHAPEASHLLLLEAVAGGRLVRTAYEHAVREAYLWHEFGDSSLFLP